MGDFYRALDDYIAGLEREKFPKYSTIKSLLRTLSREDRDSPIFNRLKAAFRGRYELLDKAVKVKEYMAHKSIREPIEKDRRENGVENWYASTDTKNGTDSEEQVTELISAVDIIYYLIFRADVNPGEFPRLIDLDDDCKLGLAKLMCAFTGDFKILEICLQFEENARRLLRKMIDYLPNLIFEKQRFSENERRDFHRLVMAKVDNATVREKRQVVFGHFDSENDDLAGDRKELFTALALIALVCNDERIQKTIDLSRFWSEKEGEPYLLRGVERTVEYGAEAMRHLEIDALEGVRGNTEQRRKENSLRVLTLVLPILQLVARHHLRGFSAQTLRAQVDRIRSRRHDAYLREYRHFDLEMYNSFIACLNEFI